MHTTPIGASIVTALALIASTAALPSHAQGVLKPVEARIVNTPSQPVPVAVAPTPLTPVMTWCRAFLSDGSADCLLYEVPDGKRLIIESVSWQFVTSPTAVVRTLVVGANNDSNQVGVLFGAKAQVVATPRTVGSVSAAGGVGAAPGRAGESWAG